MYQCKNIHLLIFTEHMSRAGRCVTWKLMRKQVSYVRSSEEAQNGGLLHTQISASAGQSGMQIHDDMFAKNNFFFYQ